MNAQDILTYIWLGMMSLETYPHILSTIDMPEHEAKEWLNDIVNNGLRLSWWIDDDGITQPCLR